MILPTQSLETKLQSIDDLRALSLELRDAKLKERAPEFFTLFERLKHGPLTNYNHATLEGLRYAFRHTWAKNDFAAVVQAGENLAQEILQQEPLFAAYLHAAKEKLSAFYNT